MVINYQTKRHKTVKFKARESSARLARRRLVTTVNEKIQIKRTSCFSLPLKCASDESANRQHVPEVQRQNPQLVHTSLLFSAMFSRKLFSILSIGTKNSWEGTESRRVYFRPRPPQATPLYRPQNKASILPSAHRPGTVSKPPYCTK